MLETEIPKSKDQEPLKKTMPAVYHPSDQKTVDLISSQGTEIRLLLSEGFMLLKEVASIANVMSPFALYIAFGSLMLTKSWNRFVMCGNVTGSNGEQLGIFSKQGFTPSEFSDEVFAPDCWGKRVLNLVSKGVGSVEFKHDRHVARFFHPKSRVYLHLKSNPCHFELTDIPYVKEAAAA